jgi:hypothetical protein
MSKGFRSIACLAALVACGTTPGRPLPGSVGEGNAPSPGAKVDDEGTAPGAVGADASVTDEDAGVDDDASVDPDPVDAAIYNTPVQCSSGTHWTQGDTKSDEMKPGSACRSCHAVGGSASGKSFDVSGTVYATAHEPDDCNGVNLSGAKVVITDANGQTTNLSVNAAGNFYHDDLIGFLKIPTPFRVKVVYGGKQRAMVGTVTNGDCNSCHTQNGAQQAPGRIMLP